MPRGLPTEKSINSLIQKNIERGLENKKKWETIKKDNKIICKSCKEEKSLEYFGKRNDNKKYETWETACINCESTRKNKVSQERALRNGLEWNIKNILRGIVTRAKKYKKEIDINLLFLIELFNKQNGICVYSGRKMKFDINSQERLSLDRKDSNKGYTKDNVVWCCWQANNIKQDLNLNDLKQWINDIYSILNQ